jgi:hypothetical protein
MAQTQEVSKYQDQLLSLAESTRSHRALNNPFYDRWLSRPLEFHELKNLREIISPGFRTVPDQITRALLATADLEAKCENH